ncbi:MAG TPA: hypothetical protein VHB53_03440 [Solirubrobacterales bacterium]|nr:hypothetical protein [Solirubrobacterales bacterium]
MAPRTLFEQRRRASKFAADALRKGYRDEIAEAAKSRQNHLAEAERAGKRIADLLPGAFDAGLGADEIVGLTGYSRASIYRMRSAAEPREELAIRFADLSVALQNASARKGHPALLFDLSIFLDHDMGELMVSLAELLAFTVDRYDVLGSAASISLIDLLPLLPESEKVAVSQTVQQRLALSTVAASMQRPEVEVAAWIVLGLMRMLPELEAQNCS